MNRYILLWNISSNDWDFDERIEQNDIKILLLFVFLTSSYAETSDFK